MPNRPLLFFITSKDVPVTRWDLYPWSPASSRHCRGCYWIWFRHASSLQAPGPKPREISWGDQLDSQLSVFLHIFSGRIEKGSVASRRAWHFDSCCSVCSFVHVGSLRACTDSRQTHVPALARRCKTHDTGAIKLSFSLADWMQTPNEYAQDDALGR